MTASGEWVVELVKPVPEGGTHVFRAYGYASEAEAQQALAQWQQRLGGYHAARVRKLDEGEVTT